jgi:hypothetical protein
MMYVGRINVGSWLLRVLTWDTLLPTVVLVVPAVVGILFPQNEVAWATTQLVLPTGGFILRFCAGKRHVFSNNCGPTIQRRQFFIFVIGILALVVVDALLVLSRVNPKKGLAECDRIVLVTCTVIYTFAMIIAMYPGRSDVT